VIHQARKRFGQNFLHDAGIIKRIVDSVAPGPDDHFLEIGPGKGAITQPLAARAAKLDVIEIDRDLAADLQAQPWFAGITLHETDALKFCFADIQTDQKLRLVGNLPYNISTPLLFHMLASHKLFSDAHVMLQKEVVQRMTASPGNKNYGRLTVALAAYCEVKSLFIIRPGAFTPAPKVDSAFACLKLLPEPLIGTDEHPIFDDVIRQAFGQRRKQLGNALRSLLSPDDFAAAGIDPSRRAEELGVDEFIALSRQIHAPE
jgi:16S rRNA (adenine1518-N6/adenine1519-N6)-dimethyltransferase